MADNSILARLREPSTWAGIAGLLAAAGVAVPAPVFHEIAFAGVVAASAAAVIMREGASKAFADGDILKAVEGAVSSLDTPKTASVPASPAPAPDKGASK